MYQGLSKENGGVIGNIADNVFGLDISDAMETSAAEESLVGVARTEEDETVQLIKYGLVSRLDVDSGALVWGEFIAMKEILQRTVGMSLMTSMLHDSDRNNIYQNALRICIRNFIEVAGRSPVILDVGAGTGLLSYISIQEGAQFVYGVEMFEAMADIATEIGIRNGFADVSTILPIKSTDFEAHRSFEPDILVSELLDSALLGESCIPTHIDAIARLLKQNDAVLPNLQQRVIPYDATVFVTLIKCSEMVDMHNASKIGKSENGDWLNPWRNEAAKECKGGWVPIPFHWQPLQERGAKKLSNPTMMIQVNFCAFQQNMNSAQSNPEENNEKTFTALIQVTSSGRIDGVMMHWTLYLLSPSLDPDRKCCYSTEPMAQNWQDHWLPVIYPLPISLEVLEGDQIEIVAKHDDIRITIISIKNLSQNRSECSSNLPNSSEVVRPDPKKMRLDQLNQRNEVICDSQCSCGWHLLYGLDRIHMMNDYKYRNCKWQRGIQIIVDQFIDQLSHKQTNDPTAVIDVSDGSLLIMYFVKEFKRHQTAPVPTSPIFISRENKQFSSLFFNQLIQTNELDEDIIIVDKDEDLREYLQMTSTTETSENTLEENQTAQIIVLLSECFYHQLASLPTWQALSFFFESKALRKANLLHPNAIIFPQKAHFMVAAVQLHDLHVSHGQTGSIQGIDHAALDEMKGNLSQYFFPYKLGNYSKTFLTKPTEMILLNYMSGESFCHGKPFSNDLQELNEYNLKVPFQLSGKCDGVVIWVDYTLCQSVDQQGNPDSIELLNCVNNDFRPYLTVNLRYLSQREDVSPDNYLEVKVRPREDKSDFYYEFQLL